MSESSPPIGTRTRDGASRFEDGNPGEAAPWPIFLPALSDPAKHPRKITGEHWRLLAEKWSSFYYKRPLLLLVPFARKSIDPHG